MDYTTRSVLGSYTQTCLLLGLPFENFPFSTLNERFDILADVPPDATARRTVRYFTIGKGGHSYSQGADGTPLLDAVQHTAAHGAAYSPLPFALVDPAADLPPEERAKYALRKLIQVPDGTTRVAYYAKRIDFTGVKVEMVQLTVDGTNIESEPFIPNRSTLWPEPPVLENTGVNVLEGKYLRASAKITLRFTSTEVDHLLNAARILYGDERYAYISEIELVAGVDHPVEIQIPGQGRTNFNDVIGAVVVSHLNTNYPAKSSRNLIEATFDVGATEPLFKLESEPA